LLEDMSKVADAAFQVKKPIIYLKSIIRTIVKGVVTQKQKSDISKKTGDSILGILANAAIDTAVGISENADLRCWRLMPGKCLVGEFVVKPGSHKIEIHYLDSANRIVI